ncbi:substrate-binding domain-containing protein [Dactylosporangium sp. NPDC048998]|uniref:substrate-binding domain-containing protein n=1 Tax=Dactylosporangium sp. NPDC048998 TaxID=3363976 RepID=UPI00371CC4D8
MLLVLASGAVGPDSMAWGAVGHARIEGTGSSAAASAINQFVADVSGQGLQVSYTPTGSSSARQDFANYAVDYAVSDIPFQGSDPLTGMDDTSRGRPFAYLPVVASATAFPYQIRVDGTLVRDLRLSGRTLAKIFTNQITNWNDPAITADNGGRALPSLTIIPVLHAEGSGATWQLTAYLADQFPDDWAAFTAGPARPTSYFPHKGNSVPVTGSDGVMNAVEASYMNGAIGYNEYPYAHAQSWPVAQVRNAAGAFTAPTTDGVTVALSRAVIDANPNSPTYLTANLSQVYTAPDPRAYPLSSYTYAILPIGTDAQDVRIRTAKRQTLVDFFAYALCTGQAGLDRFGYAPLSQYLVAAGLDQLRRLHDADPAVDVTGLASCGTAGGSNTAGVPLGADDQTEPYEGGVTLQVAGGTAVHLRQLDPGAPGGHPAQATDPTGHRHAWVFTGDLTGIAVSDTRPGQPGWTLTGQATDFVAGSTTISGEHFGWTPALIAAGSDAEGTPVAGPVVAPRMQVPASGGLAGPGGTLASSPAGSGLGTQRVGAGMLLWIPDTAPTGTYTSTLTLTLISP